MGFGRSTIIVREEKEGRTGLSCCPQRLIPGLQGQIGAGARTVSCRPGCSDVAWRCQMLSTAKYPRAGASWNWFWVFPRIRIPSILALGWFAGTTCMTKRFNEPSSARCHPLAFPSRPPPIPFVILLRRLCCRLATTSDGRSCLAMPTSSRIKSGAPVTWHRFIARHCVAGRCSVSFSHAWLCRFFGIIIRMYSEIGGPHHVPHFHAYYQDDVAIFSLEPDSTDGGATAHSPATAGRGLGGTASG